MSKKLGLAIPARQKPGKDSFNIRPRNVERWLDALPKANLGETARQIYRCLKETNQLDLSHQHRTRYLESLRETVQYITDSMRKHFFGLTYPLPRKNQKIAAATREINLAMAVGYKIALEDALKSSVLFQDKKHLTLLIHRAISYTGRALLTSYQVYSPYPEGMWGELNKLYAFAELRKLQHLGIADFRLMYGEKSTIEEEYLRNCLLWLASPYKLRQGEAVKIYNSLERFTRDCAIHKLDNPDHPAAQGLFAINLASEAPPGALSHHLKRPNHSVCRIINTDALAERLRQDILESEDVVTTTLSGIDMGRRDLSHDLLRRLLTAWGLETHRTFPRINKKEHVQVAAGLTSIHQILVDAHQSNKTDAEFGHTAEFESSVVENLTDEKPDIWNMVYPSGSDVQLTQIVTSELKKEESSPSELEKELPVLADSVNDDDPIEENSWVIINESARGYCLKYTEEGAAKAQVGELIGIRRRISNRSWKWNIGVIRWMKFNPERELELGIEMLNANAAAIGMRVAAKTRNQSYHRTLLLPDVKANNQPASLVTGPVPWRVGNKLTLNILGKNVQVELTRMLQNTGLFAQFQFEFLQEKKQVQEVKKEDWLEDQDFGQIWSTI